MKKIIENFKKMPLLKKIAAISFFAAFVIFLSAILLGYIGDIFFFGLFKSMFGSAYNFFTVIFYFVQTVLLVLYAAALCLAMFSGNRRYIAAALLCKAIIMSANMFFVMPLKRFLLVILYGFKASIIPGSVIWGGFLNLLTMLALIALAILVLKGFGRFTKLAGFITAGIFSFVFVIDVINLVKVLINCVKNFIQGNIAAGIFGLMSDSAKCCAVIILAAGYILLALSVALAAKGALIPKKEVKE